VFANLSQSVNADERALRPCAALKSTTSILDKAVLLMTSNKNTDSDSFFNKVVQGELDKDKKETERLRELSAGLEWLKKVIDNERDRHIESKLLTLKLLYAGYFGTQGRKSKYANNPCAIRDAINFCKENRLPPPEWTLNYIYGLMSGDEKPPTEQDIKRWNILMRLLDIAAEWDKKAGEGMLEAEIEKQFIRKGISDKAIKYARSFVQPRAKQVVYNFARSFAAEKFKAADDLELEMAIAMELQEETDPKAKKPATNHMAAEKVAS
jgi:hypothetical protein